MCVKGIGFEDDVHLGLQTNVNDEHREALENAFGLELRDISELKSMTINNYEYRKDLFIINQSQLYRIEKLYVGNSQIILYRLIVF